MGADTHPDIGKHAWGHKCHTQSDNPTLQRLIKWIFERNNTMFMIVARICRWPTTTMYPSLCESAETHLRFNHIAEQQDHNCHCVCSDMIRKVWSIVFTWCAVVMTEWEWAKASGERADLVSHWFCSSWASPHSLLSPRRVVRGHSALITDGSFFCLPSFSRLPYWLCHVEADCIGGTCVHMNM